MRGARAAGAMPGVVLLAMMAGMLNPCAAPAQVAGDTPPALQGIGILDHPGGSIPLDLRFRDERGDEVRLGDYFRSGRPVVLQLGYYRCPMLCGLVLNGMVEGLKSLGWTPGTEYQVLSVSIDPAESPVLATAKKQETLAGFEQPVTPDSWHFLTSPRAADVKMLADAVGFGYRWDDDTGQFAHAAGIFVLTPDGHVSRTLYGIEFPPKTLRLAMVEASKGKVGNAFDQVLLFCYHYDSASGRYTPAAENIMRLGGTATVLALGLMLLALRSRDRRSGDRTAAAATGPRGGSAN